MPVATFSRIASTRLSASHWAISSTSRISVCASKGATSTCARSLQARSTKSLSFLSSAMPSMYTTHRSIPESRSGLN